MTTESRYNQVWWTLRLTYGLVPIVAGLDKFTNLLADWPGYLGPIATGILPISAAAFMNVVGIVEIAAGALVLSRWTRLGAYVVTAWLIGIALNLITTGQFLDVAVRDLVMAVGAFTLARMTEALGEPSLAASRAQSPQTAHAR